MVVGIGVQGDSCAGGQWGVIRALFVLTAVCLG